MNGPACREKRRKQGLSYARSNCDKCGSIVRAGWRCPEEAEAAPAPAALPSALDMLRAKRGAEPFWGVRFHLYGPLGGAAPGEEGAEITRAVVLTLEEVIGVLEAREAPRS